MKEEVEEKVLFEAVVCLLVKNGQVLMGLKAAKIGAGCWNGYGGGINEGESIEEAAIRELEEETGKNIGDVYITTQPEYLEKVAIMDFHNQKTDGTVFVCRVHFFIVHDWQGEAIATDEMFSPTPFTIDDLPYQEMMPADREYFPLILSGKKILGSAKYGPYQKELLEPILINEVDNFEE